MPAATADENPLEAIAAKPASVVPPFELTRRGVPPILAGLRGQFRRAPHGFDRHLPRRFPRPGPSRRGFPPSPR
jgi:hypothetical protein